MNNTASIYGNDISGLPYSLQANISEIIIYSGGSLPLIGVQLLNYGRTAYTINPPVPLIVEMDIIPLNDTLESYLSGTTSKTLYLGGTTLSGPSTNGRKFSFFFFSLSVFISFHLLNILAISYLCIWKPRRLFIRNQTSCGN